MLIGYLRGQASIVLRVKILDSGVSTGAGKTGLLFSSSGLIISTIADNEASATTYTAAGSTTETIVTLGTYAAPTATKCRFKEVDATNHPGVYEIQIADARFAVSSAKSLLVSISGVSGAAQCDAVIPLRDLDPYNATSAGISRLDAAVSTRLATSGYTAPLDAAGTRTAVGLASANLDTQLGAIDDFIDTEVAAILAAVDTEVAAIKAKTDSLTFTVAGKVDSNLRAINGTTVNGDGAGTPWGP